jgi:pimeloyl-ACP methyl ester carboxylesterase
MNNAFPTRIDAISPIGWLNRTLEILMLALALKRADGRIVWKRDPAITKGFVPTELWASVRKIACPVIYVLGGASTIVPVQTQEQLRRVLPQVQIVAMPGLGHYPSEENPADFLAIADRFLA